MTFADAAVRGAGADDSDRIHRRGTGLAMVGHYIIDNREIAEEIIERSPAIALRLTGAIGSWETPFITENIATYGYSRDDFLSGKIGWMDVVHPQDREDLVTLVHGFDEMRNDQFNIIYRIVSADGTPVWVSDNTTALRDENGNIAYWDCIISDYTETKERIERIGENHRQQAVLNEILQGLHDSDLGKAMQIILDSSGAYLDLSRVALFEDSEDRRTCRVVHEWCNRGIAPLRAEGEVVLDYEKDLSGLTQELDQNGHLVINGGELPEGMAVELRREGVKATVMFAVTINDERYGFICFDDCATERQWDRETVGFLGSVSSLVAPVIIRRRNEMIIQSLALTDQLTGLNNRHYLEICLSEAIDRSRELGQTGYVLFIDMDDFKVINDAYGHDYGDAILKEVSSFLRLHFGDDNNIFRFGGDEFVILVEPEQSPNIRLMIDGLIARAQLPWTVIDRTFYCTLSVGVVNYPEGQEDSREIIKNADIAMYQAKKLGKNSYVFYSNTINDDSLVRAQIEQAMRESIENGFEGVEIHYQPLARADRGIVGVEALLRWNLPNGHRLNPSQFIPLAEYLGLIVPIGEHVLEKAAALCRQINRKRPEFFVSVNVSIRQFKHRTFRRRFLDILDASGVRHSNIVLEITEGMAIHDMQLMKNLADELRRNGIRMAMDDFGTGYSSLGNLWELPIDVVKIDKTFINDVTTDPYSKSFIRFISDLVHSLGRKVCVEGVETQDQLDYCRECDVDYMQGFHLWPPLTGEDLVDLLGSTDAVSG